MSTIRIPTLVDAQRATWRAPFDLAERMPRGWTVVGGQMAHLHAWDRRSAVPMRSTTDGDVVVDVRADRHNILSLERTLAELSFTSLTINADGKQIRHVRGEDGISLLRALDS